MILSVSIFRVLNTKRGISWMVTHAPLLRQKLLKTASIKLFILKYRIKKHCGDSHLEMVKMEKYGKMRHLLRSESGLNFFINSQSQFWIFTERKGNSRLLMVKIQLKKFTKR